MRKFIAVIAVSLLIGGLLASAGPASAATFNYLPFQGGIADPLTLGASGVLVPFNSGGTGGVAALIEVASPLGDHNDLHMIFFNEDCARTGVSVPAPVTENGVVFVDPVVAGIAAPKRGLVAISNLPAGSSQLQPFSRGVHARVYQFDPSNGRSQVFEPIILDTYEFNSSRCGDPSGGGSCNSTNPAEKTGMHIWSPLRTGITFFAPPESATVNTLINFICPRSTIQGAAGAAFGSWDPATFNGVPPYTTLGAVGYPVIWPPFNSGKTTLTGFVYIHGGANDEEVFRDLSMPCDCLTANVPLQGVNTPFAPNVYLDPALAGGSFTKLRVAEVFGTPNPPAGTCGTNTLSPYDCDADPDGTPINIQVGSMTGWRSSFTVNNPFNNFFTRFSDGAGDTLFGPSLNPGPDRFDSR